MSWMEYFDTYNILSMSYMLSTGMATGNIQRHGRHSYRETVRPYPVHFIKLSLSFPIDGTKNEITPIIPTNAPPIINVFPIPMLSARNPVLSNPIIEGNRLTLI